MYLVHLSSIKSLVIVSIDHDALMRLCIFAFLLSRSTIDHNRSQYTFETLTIDH